MLNQKHLLDLRSSGIDDEIIKLAGFKTITRMEANELLGFDPGSSGLYIPYQNSNGSKFARFKPDTPFTKDNGRAAKYLSPKTASNHLYIPCVYDNKRFKDNKFPIIFTEGEKKALKGAQDLPGFLVLGLAGVWCWKTKDKPIIDDFKNFSWQGRNVYICYDSDVVQKKEVQEAETALAKALDKMGAEVNICRIPGTAEKKYGLDDYLLRHSPEIFVEQIIDKAWPCTTQGVLRVEDLGTFLDRKFPQNNDIIGGGILPEKSIAVLSAYSKMGKSIFALNMAMSIAAGKPLLCQFDVPKPLKVLYVNEEIAESQLQKRLRPMVSSAIVEGSNIGNINSNLLVVTKTGLKLDTVEGRSKACRLLRYSRPRVVIWDCLYRLHNGNENRAEDMQKVFDAFDYFSKSFECAHVIIHHHGTPQKDSEREGFQLIRGSSVIGAYGDSYLTITKYKKNEEGNKYQKLSFTLRNAECPEDLVLARNPETLWYEVVNTFDEAKGKTTLSIQNVIFTLKEMGGHTKQQNLTARIIDLYNVSERTAIKSIGEAVKLNRIKKRILEGGINNEKELYCHD